MVFARLLLTNDGRFFRIKANTTIGARYKLTIKDLDKGDGYKYSGYMTLSFAAGPVGDLIVTALKKGLVIISAGANIIRFVPPLVIEKKDVDEMIAKLEKCF